MSRVGRMVIVLACSPSMIHHLHTVDAHTAGEPLRMILRGFPEPKGETMLDKRACRLKRHADHLRRALMLEPRGHQDMYGALLTRPGPGRLGRRRAVHARRATRPMRARGDRHRHAGVRAGAADDSRAERRRARHAGRQVEARAAVARRTGPGAASDVKPLGRQEPGRGHLSHPRDLGGVSERSVVRAAPRPPGACGESGRMRVDVAFGGAFSAIVDAEAAACRTRPTPACRICGESGWRSSTPSRRRGRSCTRSTRA